MNICFISGSWPPAHCGIGDSLPPLLNKLTEDINEVNLITTTGYDQKYSDKIIVHDIISRWNSSACKIILNKLKQLRIELVHIQYTPKEYKKNIFINLLPHLLRSKNYKIVVTIHEYSNNSLLGRIRLLPAILSAHNIFVPDHHFISDIKKVFPKKKIEFVQQAPNIPQSLLSEEDKLKLKNELLRGGFNLLLGFFGLIDNNKILVPVIFAIKKLKDDHGINSKLLLIGKPIEEEPAFKNLKENIEKLNLSDNCIITGYVDKNKAADFISVLDFAVQIYKNGISPRHASFLAAVNQNIKVITTPSESYKPEFENIYYLNNEDSLADEIVKTVMKNMNTKPAEKLIDISAKILNEAKEKHLSVYKKLLNTNEG